jgi:hypothetical protein
MCLAWPHHHEHSIQAEIGVWWRPVLGRDYVELLGWDEVSSWSIHGIVRTADAVAEQVPNIQRELMHSFGVIYASLRGGNVADGIKGTCSTWHGSLHFWQCGRVSVSVFLNHADSTVVSVVSTRCLQCYTIQYFKED